MLSNEKWEYLWQGAFLELFYFNQKKKEKKKKVLLKYTRKNSSISFFSLP